MLRMLPRRVLAVALPRLALSHRRALLTAAPGVALAIALVAWPAIARAQTSGRSGDPRLRTVTSSVERELRQDNHSRAFRSAEQGIQDVLEAGPADVDHAAIGRLLEYLAIAAAGRRQPDTASWNWSLAQSLDPALSDDDLSRWGEEGTFLSNRPLRAPAHDGDVIPEGALERRHPLNLFSAPDRVETRLPDEQNVPPPRYPPALRGSGIEGTVLLQVRIDRRGHTNDPLILESPHAILALAAAEAVREWRYRPAEVDGEKVGVYYSVRIDFRAE